MITSPATATPLCVNPRATTALNYKSYQVGYRQLTRGRPCHPTAPHESTMCPDRRAVPHDTIPSHARVMVHNPSAAPRIPGTHQNRGQLHHRAPGRADISNLLQRQHQADHIGASAGAASGERREKHGAAVPRGSLLLRLAQVLQWANDVVRNGHRIVAGDVRTLFRIHCTSCTATSLICCTRAGSRSDRCAIMCCIISTHAVAWHQHRAASKWTAEAVKTPPQYAPTAPCFRSSLVGQWGAAGTAAAPSGRNARPSFA